MLIAGMCLCAYLHVFMFMCVSVCVWWGLGRLGDDDTGVISPCVFLEIHERKILRQEIGSDSLPVCSLQTPEAVECPQRAERCSAVQAAVYAHCYSTQCKYQMEGDKTEPVYSHPYWEFCFNFPGTHKNCTRLFGITT